MFDIEPFLLLLVAVCALSLYSLHLLALRLTGRDCPALLAGADVADPCDYCEQGWSFFFQQQQPLQGQHAQQQQQQPLLIDPHARRPALARARALLCCPTRSFGLLRLHRLLPAGLATTRPGADKGEVLPTSTSSPSNPSPTARSPPPYVAAAGAAVEKAAVAPPTTPETAPAADEGTTPDLQ